LDKHVEFTLKLRETCKLITDIANEYMEFIAAKEKKNPVAAALETTFSILHFEPQQGAKLGEYEVANKTNNLPDKWSSGYNILRDCNATIKDRYHGEGYQHSYWLYVEDKIYRQKLKPKTKE
jgi:hypothetical protein